MVYNKIEWGTKTRKIAGNNCFAERPAIFFLILNDFCCEKNPSDFFNLLGVEGAPACEPKLAAPLQGGGLAPPPAPPALQGNLVCVNNLYILIVYCKVIAYFTLTAIESFGVAFGVAIIRTIPSPELRFLASGVLIRQGPPEKSMTPEDITY